MGFIEKIIDKVAYGNDPEIICNKNKNNFNKLSIETVISSIGLLLIQGTFQTKLLLKLGADVNQISLLNSLILAASMSCILGGSLFNRLKKRKTAVVLIQTLSRAVMSIMYFVPLILPQSAYPVFVRIFIAVIVLCYASVGISSVGYESLLAELSDKRLRGRFMAARNLMSFVLTPLSPLIGAWALDKTNNSWVTFAVFGGICLVLLIISALIFNSIDEPEFEVTASHGFSFKEALNDLKSQKSFLFFILEMFLFTTFLYICGSFTSIYLNSTAYLGLSAFLVEILTFFLCVAKTLLVRLVGRLNDKISAGKTLYICQCFFGIEMLSWALLPPKLLPALIFVPYILQSLSNVTSAVCSYPRKFDVCPRENAGFYLGLYGFITSIAYFVGPWIGRRLLAYFSSVLSEQAISDHWEIRIIYLISALLIIVQKLIQLAVKRKPEV